MATLLLEGLEDFFILVLSPPCGMETCFEGKSMFPTSSTCSKPTVWDGDIRKLRKWLTKVCSFFVPKPTVWDSNWHSYLCTSGILPSVPNVPLGSENLELKEKGLNF